MHAKNTFPECDSTQGVNSLQNQNYNMEGAIRLIDSAAVNLPALVGNQRHRLHPVTGVARSTFECKAKQY
jgi:hypothetical protein